jgi:hypothetical protein
MKQNKHNPENTEDKKPDTNETWEKVSRYLEGKSLLEIYMKSSSIVTDNEIITFRIKRIRVKTGMNLLPLNNPDLSEEQRKELKEIYTNANIALKKYFPDKRRTSFSFEDLGDNVFEVYKIESDDLQEYHSRPQDIDIVLEDFKRQQFEFHSQELEETDNKIQQMLMKYEIIPKSSPDIEFDKKRTKMYQKLNV